MKKRKSHQFQGMMTSLSPHWATPEWLYKKLNGEFRFNYDPCPLNANFNGLKAEWGSRTFVNPPYGRGVDRWIKHGYEESQKGNLVVFLIPSRTDTKWWHDYIMKAEEIRFIRGRLIFKGAKYNAPFPSCIVIFKGK